MVSVKICPHCGGALEPVGERTGGFSGTKAVVGAVIAGPVGVAAGALGKKLYTLRCEACGFTLEVTESQAGKLPEYAQAIAQAQEQPSPPQDHNVLWLAVNEQEPVAKLLLPTFRKPLLSDADWARQREQNQAVAVSREFVIVRKADGTVLAAGKNDNGQCQVEDWRDITAVYAVDGASFGLRKDGTVAAAGQLENGLEQVRDWRDVQMMAFGTFVGQPFAIGLTRAGTLLLAGHKMENALASKRAQGKDLLWQGKNVFVAAGASMCLGVLADGKVTGFGRDSDGSMYRTNHWTDMVSLSCGRGCTYGIRKDGAILRAGFDIGPTVSDSSPLAESLRTLNKTTYLKDVMDFSKKEVSDLFELSWGVGALAVSYDCWLAADGTVHEKYGQRYPGTWHDIVAVAAGAGLGTPMAGIRADGTLVVSGSNVDETTRNWTGLYVDSGLRETVLRRIPERMEEDDQYWEEEQRRVWREQRKCQHCGGDIAFFGKKCKNCGVVKDY